MASVQTSKYDGRYLKLTVTEESTSIENNTSTIKWVLESIGGNSNYYNIYDCKVTINNQVVYGPTSKTWDSYVFPAKKGTVSGTITVSHNADGTSPDIGFTLRGSVYYNNPQNYNGSIPLTTIPRASSITVLDANIGSSTNITINKASSSFTTTLYYKASGQSSWTKIVDKTTNQVYGWTVPTSFYGLIPNSKTISCQFYAETYLDGNYVGTSPTINATFTATGIPSINSISAIDTNSTTVNLTGNSSNMVRYASNVKVTVSASGVNSADISSIKVNGIIATNGVVTFNSCNTNSFEVVVTDTRGYTKTQTKTMTMVNYIPLTLSASIERNLPTDGKIKISYSGNYYNGSFGSQSNTLTVQYRYKLKGGSFGNWTNLSPTKSGNTYYQNNYIISGFNYTNQYEFEIKAIDKINTVSIIGISVAKGKPVINWADELFNVNGDLTNNGLSITNIINRLKGDSVTGGNANNYNVPCFHYMSSNNNSNVPDSWFEMLTIGNGGNDVAQLGIGVSSENIHMRVCNSGNWHAWKRIAFASEIPTNNNQLTNGRGYITSSSLPSVTSGTFTCTKSSGNGNITASRWFRYGNVMMLEIVFNTSSGTTSAGSNIWSGKVSGIPLPYYRATGTGYYSATAFVAGLYGDNADNSADVSRLDIRALIGTQAKNSDKHSLSITYIIP